MSTTRLLRLPTLRPLRIQAFSPLTTPKPTKPLRPSHRTLTSTRPLQDSTPIRKPVGAFRGGLLGFFVGATLAGASVWFYILQEYRVSNEMLGEDVYVSLLLCFCGWGAVRWD